MALASTRLNNRLTACALAGGCVLLALLVAACSLTTAGAERRVDEARGIGETWRYTFDAPPTRPFEWIDEETVVFLTASGTATVDVPTGSVTERTDPDITPSQQPERPVQGPKLQPGSRYGPWTVTGDSRFLMADSHGDVRCGSLLVSPDERYVACSYGVVDRMAESSTGDPAVVRLRGPHPSRVLDSAQRLPL